jgi:S-adenosylmethionine hydrolase
VVAYDWISLTTDYGLSDGFVAVMHGVIARGAPRARVIDITHLIAPADVTHAAAVMAQTVPHLPDAVHVGVVDPGVGTARRAVAIRAARGVLVGPDNGLLIAAAEALGGITGAVALTNLAWHADSISATFHGRDIFAPVAAKLAAGNDFGAAGSTIDPTTLVRLPDPTSARGDGWIDAEVMTVDRFGNVQLAAPGDWLNGLPRDVVAGGVHAVRGRTFTDAPPGELLVYEDSARRVALAINGGRAVVALAVNPGDILRIESGPAANHPDA